MVVVYESTLVVALRLEGLSTWISLECGLPIFGLHFLTEICLPCSDPSIGSHVFFFIECGVVFVCVCVCVCFTSKR